MEDRDAAAADGSTTVRLRPWPARPGVPDGGRRTDPGLRRGRPGTAAAARGRRAARAASLRARAREGAAAIGARALQRARREQLRGDQSDEEAVPDQRPRPGERPLDHRMQRRRIRDPRAEELVGDLKRRNSNAIGAPIANARRCGGVPVIIRQRAGRRRERYGDERARGRIGRDRVASDGCDAIARPLSGHSARQPEIEPSGPTCGSSRRRSGPGTGPRRARRADRFAARPSRRPVGNVRISTKRASSITFSQTSPIPNSQGWLDDCSAVDRRHGSEGEAAARSGSAAPAQPVEADEHRPEDEVGLLDADQPGYARKSASSVAHTAATAASTATTAATGFPTTRWDATAASDATSALR